MTLRLAPRGAKILRALFFVALTGAIGQGIAKLMASGDESSDVFRLAAIVGGREFKSTASALRSGSVLAVMGGVELDLREAHLDPSGATLHVSAVMGGVEVRLPLGWAVEVESHGHMGGVDKRLTEPSDLPDGAPTLHVTTSSWMGGVEIREHR